MQQLLSPNASGRLRFLSSIACTCAFGLLLAPAAQAANPVTEVRLDTLDTGRLGVVFGGRFGNRPYVNVDDITSVYSDQSWDLVPGYLYKGERLFSTGTTIGAHLFQGSGFTLDAQVSYRFDRLEAEADPYFDGVYDRRQSLDGGFAGTYAGDWGEITSTSNCTDYQARRLKIRVKRKEGKKNEILHTLNGTAVSNARAILALLENHQRADGSVAIPKALQPYVGRDVIGPR